MHASSPSRLFSRVRRLSVFSRTPHVGFFDVNTTGRDFVIGDVHGHFELLDALLAEVQLEPSIDRVFCTGDLIDRGPGSAQVLDWLSRPWFHSVRGNHEQMVLDYMSGKGDAPRHARNGGAWFYELAQDHQVQIATALLAMPVALQVQLSDTSAIGVVHAECPGWENGLSWQHSTKLLVGGHHLEQSTALLQAMYARGKISRQDAAAISGIKTVYVGHSTVPHVTQLGNVVYLDTGCSFADGHLSAIEIANQQVFSAYPATQGC